MRLNNTNKIKYNIDVPQEGIDSGRYGEFIRVLEESKFLDRVTEKTSLKWLEPNFNIKFANEAEFDGLDTVFVDYNRGARAVSSTIHESFHLMLRQIKWTENPVVKGMVERYPELVNSSHGVGYKLEQMFAYLLQNEIYQEIAKDLNFDASKDYWDRDFITASFIPDGYDTPFLENLALVVIDVWYSPNRSNDIFEMIRVVDGRM